MSYVTGLRCQECGAAYSQEPIQYCSACFGPLEVTYDYERIRRALSRDVIVQRPYNLWRYRELLPLDAEPVLGQHTGFTPLVRARNLGRVLGLRNLYLKNDAVTYPTLSFKDRVVAVALSKAREFGYDTVACASTGNLANALAAQAAQAGLQAVILVPADIEPNKIAGTLVYGPTLIPVQGTYDQVNRLCAEIGDTYRWGFVNINLRPFYSEGSKTVAYEICEQLGWRAPDHVVVPVGGGSLITKIRRGIQELALLGQIAGASTRLHAAQASGCAPVAGAYKRGGALVPVRPDTIAKSIAMGNPADGHYALEVVRDSGGAAEDIPDAEIAEAMELLARTEGIFGETTGGVVVGVARKLARQGRFGPDDTIVLCITASGLKTPEALSARLRCPAAIPPRLSDFQVYWQSCTSPVAALA